LKAYKPGKIILFGSGETSASGRRVFDLLFRSMSEEIRVSILETPAGFELNSEWVAGQVAEFLIKRLKNYNPDIKVIPARKRGTPFSPDRPEIVEPLLSSNVIYMGAGSPTYAVKQLEDSLAWHILVSRHRMGANIVWASASPLAVSAYTIPVYEIYKVGEDLHWKDGLDFFKPFGLDLVFVPHWNNIDGGDNLDTSRCYMGQSRFSQLHEMLPESAIVVGIEEHTALIIDMNEGVCSIMGKGGVVILHERERSRFEKDESFNIEELGPFRLPDLWQEIPEVVMEQVLQARVELESEKNPEPPRQVLKLLEAREIARRQRRWGEADRLRSEILELGWSIRDTGESPELVPKDD
jgi:cyanophycinase-like exopeptidase